MSNLFISHSTQDQEAVQQFVDFLVLGMGISRNKIFCTTQSGTLLTGHSFIAQIREALEDCAQVLCFLTPNYLRSKFCMAELGAAWFQAGKIIPLVVPPLQYSDLNDTPLLGLQMLRQDRKEDLTVLYDELCTQGIAQSGQTVQFNRQLQNYIASLQRSQYAIADIDGFFRVSIEAIRPTPTQFRCYKLSKLLKLKENMLPGETHWVFYKAGMYPDLAVGDTVKIQVSSTELRDFSDLKRARNIYPDVLEKV